MGSHADIYITLMASMPALPTPFTARELPISRLRLAGRLKLLDERDAGILRRIEAVTEWAHVDMATEDAAVIAELDALMDELDSETLQSVVRDRFEVRTVLAAMRRRRAGYPATEFGANWGYGRYIEQIRRNWTRPHFRLRRTMPWIARLRELYDLGHTLELEYEIARIDWQSLTEASRFHEFDFDAVVLYVLRYNVVARWSQQSPTAAREQFDRLVADGIDDYSPLIPESL